MIPPKKFIIKKGHGWSLCIACDRWKLNNTFYHNNMLWTLCMLDYADYWENTDELLTDYKGY